MGKVVVDGWNSCWGGGHGKPHPKVLWHFQSQGCLVSLWAFTLLPFYYSGVPQTQMQFFSGFFQLSEILTQDSDCFFLQVQFYGMYLMDLEQSEVRLGKVLGYRNLLCLLLCFLPTVTNPVCSIFRILEFLPLLQSRQLSSLSVL